jgi:transposase
VHAELRRKHVTLALLWQEYREQHPEGYKYSQFCTRYRRWAGTLGAWMRQEHKAGEKLFVDYSGDGIPMIDPLSGERVTAQLFVAVLGASNYTYAEATATQTAPDWLGCHVHDLEFLGGVLGMIPMGLRPGNLDDGSGLPVRPRFSRDLRSIGSFAVSML